MLKIFFIIAPLFLIIFCAAILRKMNFIKEDWSVHLNQYALKIGLPILVFTSLSTMPIAFTEELQLIAQNMLFIITILLLSFFVCKVLHLTEQMRNTIIICLMFSNVAYLGIPVLTHVYGAQILPQLSIIVAVYLLGLFGLGVAYLEAMRRTSSHSVRRTIFTTLCTNPLLIAIFAGIVINAMNIHIPETITAAFGLINGSVTPIVLIVIGVFIGQSAIGTIRDWYGVGLFACATLVILPTIFYMGLILCKIDPLQHHLSILESAMPLGITPFALADQYDLDKKFIARAIVLSTILSIITIPAWINLVG